MMLCPVQVHSVVIAAAQIVIMLEEAHYNKLTIICILPEEPSAKAPSTFRRIARARDRNRENGEVLLSGVGTLR